MFSFGYCALSAHNLTLHNYILIFQAYELLRALLLERRISSSGSWSSTLFAHLRVLWLLGGLDWLVLPKYPSASYRRDSTLSSLIERCFFCSLKSFSSSQRRFILAWSCLDWRAWRFFSTDTCARKRVLLALRGAASLVLQEADSSSCSISFSPRKDLSITVGPSRLEDWWTVLSRYSYGRQ